MLRALIDSSGAQGLAHGVGRTRAALALHVGGMLIRSLFAPLSALGLSATMLGGCAGDAGEGATDDSTDGVDQVSEELSTANPVIGVKSWNKYWMNAFAPHSGVLSGAQLALLQEVAPGDSASLERGFTHVLRGGAHLAWQTVIAVRGLRLVGVARDFHYTVEGCGFGSSSGRAGCIPHAKAGTQRGVIGVVADLEAPLPGAPRIRAISVHFGLPDMAHLCDESANVERMKVHGGPCIAPLKVSWMHQVSAACAGAAHCVVGGDFNWTGATEVARAGGLTEVAIEDKRGHQGAAHLFEKGMRVLSGGPQIPSRLSGGAYPFYGSDHELLAGRLGL